MTASHHKQGYKKQNRNDDAGNSLQGAISFGEVEKATLQEPSFVDLLIALGYRLAIQIRGTGSHLDGSAVAGLRLAPWPMENISGQQFHDSSHRRGVVQEIGTGED
jgi:hypothetical protein